MTVSRFRGSTAGLLLAAVLAACSTSASPSADEASAEASATPEETAGAAATSDTQAGAGDLDAILPDEVGGIPLTYESASGDAVFGSEGITPEAQAFFDRTGADASDIAFAFGFGVDDAGGYVTIFAFQVSGVPEDQLLAEFRTSFEEEGAMTFTEGTAAGKDVLISDVEGQTSYIYARGDVVFMVSASTPELTDEALSALP